MLLTVRCLSILVIDILLGLNGVGYTLIYACF